MRLLLWPFKIIWFALVLSLPLLGFWLASTLTVFLNGPRWLPWLAGALALLLPVCWEFESQWRQKRKLARKSAKEGTEPVAPKHILKLSDRLILRTMTLNLLFLAVQLGAFPQKSFAALATRGDWMLEGQKASWVDPTRQKLFRVANSLEGLYEMTRNNPYVRLQQDPEQQSDEQPVPGDLDHEPVPADLAGEAKETDTGTDTGTNTAPDQNASPQTDTTQDPAGTEAPNQPTEAGTSDSSATAPSGAGKIPAWPLPNSLHPAIAKMPPAAEASIQSVAAYIGQQDPTEFGRVKAIYDYLTSRIRYDAPALMTGLIPAQDAQTVFNQKTGVCAGYANLFKALADELKIPAAFVTGDSRTLMGDVAGISHAWNAVEIEKKWYLLDATWGAGYVENNQFTPRYTSSYLMTPPEIFSIDHLPDDEKWQLRTPLLDRGEFARQPLLRASFFERGWQLLEPRRSQISVTDHVGLKLKNAKHQYLMVRLVPEGGGTASPCQVAGQNEVSVLCPIPASGSYQVMLFANTQPSGSFEYVGQVKVVS